CTRERHCSRGVCYAEGSMDVW
nr:immunoglobulin heavy chain junction region [Macaca mulatta]